MTPKGQMAFGGGPPITHLPPAMKQLFQPGPPLPFKEPLKKRRPPPYSGLSEWTRLFEVEGPPERLMMETPRDLKVDRRKASEAAQAAALAEATKIWDPQAPPKRVANLVTGEPYRTLFVARLSYDTSESKLEREFEQFGPVKKVRIVETLAEPKKSRGYAFIEFEKEADMREAYKRADGRKIDERRILVDVERGRTVRKWKPRRLGGGLGGRKDDRKTRPPPRVAPTIPPSTRYGLPTTTSLPRSSNGLDRSREPTTRRDDSSKYGAADRSYKDRDRSRSRRDRRERSRSRSRDKHRSRR